MEGRKRLVVALPGIYNQCQLVEAANKVDGDVLVKRGAYMTDAKSTVGVLAIDMRDGVLIDFPANATEFETWLKQFMGDC